MADTQCSKCNAMLSTGDDPRLELCGVCATKLGLITMPPSRRPPAPCGRCNGLQFVRVIPREHSTVLAGESNAQVTAPMYVTYPVPDMHQGWLLSYLKEIEITGGIGLLEAYICRGCGFVEWYCHDVERIPIHPQLMTELVDYAPESPYR